MNEFRMCLAFLVTPFKSMDDTVHRSVFFSFNFFVRFLLVDGNDSCFRCDSERTKCCTQKNAKQEQRFCRRRMTDASLQIKYCSDSNVKNHNFMFRIIWCCHWGKLNHYKSMNRNEQKIIGIIIYVLISWRVFGVLNIWYD